MSAPLCFSVLVLGLDETHRRLIEVVFRHIQFNRYAYRLASPAEESEADVLIAGVGDPAGREALERARLRGRPKASIAVTTRDSRPVGRHAIEIGELVRQLLPILNRVVEIEGLAGGPRRRASELASGFEPSSAASSTEDPRPRALVIDQEDSSRASVVAALQRIGLETDTAGTGLEALEKLLRRPADLAFFDPRVSPDQGVRFVRTLRSEPEWRDLPIVVLGARKSPLDVVRSALAGCNAYIAKPLEDEDLRRTVTRQLDAFPASRRRLQRPRLIDAAPLTMV